MDEVLKSGALATFTALRGELVSGWGKLKGTHTRKHSEKKFPSQLPSSVTFCLRD